MNYEKFCSDYTAFIGHVLLQRYAAKSTSIQTLMKKFKLRTSQYT